MKFEDVEKAREILIKKRSSLKKWTGIITLCITIIFVFSWIIPSISSVMENFRLKEKTNVIFSLVPVFSLIFVMIIFPIVVIELVASLGTRREVKAYKRMYKAYFVSQQLSKFFTHLEYNRDDGLNEYILKSTGIIYTGDRYSSNDLVKGKYKNIDFTQADVMVQDEHKDSNGDKSYETVFKGRYMIFEFPKKINFKMVVTSQYLPLGGAKLKKIETESTEFNENFHVYAEDGFEAFYILDPTFIAGIEDLNKVYRNCVSLYFVNNKLFIGINNGNDSFEPPKPNKPINEQAEIEKNAKDIKVITDFVDKLRLDR